MDYDLCVIGSGAGGGPVAASVAEAGYRVVVLEKGPWFAEKDFLKDEIVQCRRPTFWPRREDEPQIEETKSAAIAGSGGPLTNKFWNGVLVGGSSVLMSGFFMRQKPDDFKPLTTYGPIPGADVADWPIDYDDLEPYYDRVEREVGVSGRVLPDLPPAINDRRSSPDLPQPPTKEHPFASLLDTTCRKLGLHSIPLPRAVLSQDMGTRKACDYNGYCGSYGCTTGAKGSSLSAFISRAVATGRCDVRSQAMVFNLRSDASGRVREAQYFDRTGKVQKVKAKIFVVACQSIETARLLLNSTGPRHPRGLANRSGLVGRNLLFSSFGAGWGDFRHADYAKNTIFMRRLRSEEPFVNRIVQDFYCYDPADPRRRNAGTLQTDESRRGLVKGGTLNFLLMHPNPINAAETQAFWDQYGGRPTTAPLWGQRLKDRLAAYFTQVTHLKFEVFGEWLPSPSSFVTVEPGVKDRWGLPVARVRAFNHERSLASVRVLTGQGLDILRAAGASDVRAVADYGGPSTNLIAGSCRFGDDPERSVLNRDCRAHDVPNLYVTDGSFMPSAGAIPFTFTIYANALRVADRILGR